jgi:hypothetical protein
MPVNAARAGTGGRLRGCRIERKSRAPINAPMPT